MKKQTLNLKSLIVAKKYLILSAIIGALFFSLDTVQAQSLTNVEIENSVKKDGKYAILAQSARHLTGAVLVGAEMKESHPEIQFVIGMAGDVVKDLAEDQSLKETVEKAEKYGIKLVVCEFAMNRLNVKKSDYHAYIETTPNVYRFMLGIQELGFKTLSL